MLMNFTGTKATARFIVRGCIYLLLGSMLVQPAMAHDTWLSPNSFAVDTDTELTLSLTSGQAFPTLETAIQPDRVAEAGTRLLQNRRNIDDYAPATHALEFHTAPFNASGTATIWVRLHPRTLELEADSVRHYLDEIQAPGTVLQTWEASESGRWREQYSKHSKTFVTVGGDHSDRSWLQPVGLKLEIVPQANPLTLSAGDDLPVIVLKDGVALADFPLGITRENDPSRLIKLTDAQGRVSFTLDRPGRWLLSGTEVRPAAQPDLDWVSDFTTLTIEVKPR